MDASGKTVTTATNVVTVAIGTNPGAGTLSGTSMVAAVSGVATFSPLSLNKSGTGYTLVANSGALTGATSAAFDITTSSLPIRGLYVQFERRGYPNGFWPGQALRELDSVDAVIGTTVATEMNLELDAMRAMGVNTITYELRATDSTEWTGPFVPPECHLGLALGLRWPQPTAFELQNLARFMDIVQSKGMRVLLRLVNTHMEEQPPTNSATWLGAILGAIRNHPALELVLFEGSPHLVQTSGGVTCGIPAEPLSGSAPGPCLRGTCNGPSVMVARSGSPCGSSPPRRSSEPTS